MQSPDTRLSQDFDIDSEIVTLLKYNILKTYIVTDPQKLDERIRDYVTVVRWLGGCSGLKEAEFYRTSSIDMGRSEIRNYLDAVLEASIKKVGQHDELKLKKKCES